MVTKNSIDSNIPIEVSKGGTNAITMATSTGIVKNSGTALVTNTNNLIDSSNRQTNTAQPAFSAYNSATRADVTGTGTYYVLGTTALTEIYDQGANFDGMTFTAPVTGVYLLHISGTLTGGTLLTTTDLKITTTARSYLRRWEKPAGAGTYPITASCIAYMTAGDTATASVAGIGEVADTVDVYGTANWHTGFSGQLLC